MRGVEPRGFRRRLILMGLLDSRRVDQEWLLQQANRPDASRLFRRWHLAGVLVVSVLIGVFSVIRQALFWPIWPLLFLAVASFLVHRRTDHVVEEIRREYEGGSSEI